jgi:hypothetical protein
VEDDSTSISWQSVYKFHAAGWTCFSLESCIWPDVISLRIRQRTSKREASDAASFRVVSGEESWICSYDPVTKQQSSRRKSPDSPRRKKKETGEEQSQEHAHHIHRHQGDSSHRICPGRPNWTVPPTTRFLVNAMMKMRSPSCSFDQGMFYQKQHDSRPLSSPTHLTRLPASAVCFSNLRYNRKAIILTQFR